jgi:CelD/BcsL family acetyltransferase involved in cellulose biosynthesis
MLQITASQDPSALILLAGDWRELHDRAPAATPFSSWEWISAWWRWKGRGEPLVLCARDGGELVGLMPLVIDRYRHLPLRRVTFMGAPLSDYQDLLAAPGRDEECRDAFMSYLLAHRDRWDILDLPDVRAGSALAHAQVSEPDFWTAAPHHRVCPVVSLPDSWEAYASGLGSGLRGNLRRNRQNLGEQLGARFETVGEEELGPVMEEMFELHQRRRLRRGLPGAFAESSVRRFHHDVARQLLDRGWLRLHRIAAGGITHAAIYCMQHRARVYHYLSGFDGALAAFGLGTQLLAHAIGEGIAEGARSFDFLRGDESYQGTWRAEGARTVRLLVGQHTFRSSLAAEVNRVEREIKQLGARLRNRLFLRAA